MTIPDKLATLRAALQICDENDGAASAGAMAARFGVELDVAVRKLLPSIAEYFESSLPGDDGLAVVRQPTAEARRFAGGS
ncbi:hypothetical protein [Mycobacterium attenuatum]|uniref:hypothetical protein n=1 Tax=Mycobacterium attenuatum TaxID=2341086 RepID=UPI000F018D4C|nr:hypothetical protein [Mycobacterium attenuatum]